MFPSKKKCSIRCIRIASLAALPFTRRALLVGKPVLGRGLANLMNDAKTSTSTSSPSVPNPDRSIQNADTGKRIPPGMASLLRGTQTDSQPETPTQKPSDPKPATASHIRPSIFRNPLVAGSLILADVVLLALATRLVLT